MIVFSTPWRLLYSVTHEAWERPTSLYAVYGILPAAVRSLLFPLTAALAGWGAVVCWQRTREVAAFLLLWLSMPVMLLAVQMWHPVMLLTVFAGAWFPILFERYVIASLLPFCILIALGIWELRANWARFAAVALVAALALLRIRAYDPATDVQLGTQWAEAAKFVAPYLIRGVPVSVELRYSGTVLGYYLRKYPGVRPELVGYPGAPLIVISEQAKLFCAESEWAKVLCGEDVPKLLAGTTPVAQWNRIYVFARLRPSY